MGAGGANQQSGSSGGGLSTLTGPSGGAQGKTGSGGTAPASANPSPYQDASAGFLTQQPAPSMNPAAPVGGPLPPTSPVPAPPPAPAPQPFNPMTMTPQVMPQERLHGAYNDFMSAGRPRGYEDAADPRRDMFNPFRQRGFGPGFDPMRPNRADEQPTMDNRRDSIDEPMGGDRFDRHRRHRLFGGPGNGGGFANMFEAFRNQMGGDFNPQMIQQLLQQYREGAPLVRPTQTAAPAPAAPAPAAPIYASNAAETMEQFKARTGMASGGLASIAPRKR